MLATLFRARTLPLLLSGLLALLPGCSKVDFDTYTVLVLGPGPDLEDRLRAALLTVKPGTIIELPEGKFDFLEQVAVTQSHIVLRGKGMHKTILSYKNARDGAEGILATADQFVVQDLAVEDTPGDGIRAEGITGATFENVRVEWTNGPSTNNGAYGLYPVGSRNVLVKGCVVRGAADAGIYVGQSFNIVVRQSLAEYNVAGIEIENSQDADVYLNVATKNTGGLLVFDTKGLTPAGKNARVFNNLIFDNNTPNFARPGSTVSNVPTGTGVILLATRDVEVYDNYIDNHATVSVAIVSDEVLGLPNRQLRDYGSFDPYNERIHVHHNILKNSGYQPAGDLGLFSYLVFLGTDPTRPVPEIIYDGILENDIEKNNALPADQKFPLVTAKTDPVTGGVIASKQMCLHDNGNVGFGDFNELRLPASYDASPYDCTIPPLAAIVLPGATPPPDVPDEFTPEQIAALCNAPGTDVNWPAFAVPCPKLSDYRLFAGNDPKGAIQGGGVPYDLTTPLFSDYASKYRVVYLPPGTAATYDAENVFEFPVGTIITKTFAFPFDLAQPGLGEDLVETRLLVHRASGWVGLPYVWNDEETEAFYTPLGTAVPVGYQRLDGSDVVVDYRVPNVTQCTQCHGTRTQQKDIPIGPKARLLNRDYDYGAGPVNQLAHWRSVGILSATDEELANAPYLPVWNDPGDGTLEERARAYLESNCAHCHNPQGRARFSALFFEASRPMGLATGVCKTPISAGTGSGQLTFDLVPGNPDESIIPFRMDSVEPAVRMPELSKAIVHDEGVALVREWIASLPDQDCIHNGN